MSVPYRISSGHGSMSITSEADSVEDRLAKAEARIMGEISIMTFAPFHFHPQDSDRLPFESS